MRARTFGSLLIAVFIARVWAQTPQGSSSPSQPALGSVEARSHLIEIISVLQGNWLYRDNMDWDTFRARVLQQGSDAQTISETYDAVRFALRLLADRHTYYVTATGEIISQSAGACIPAPLVMPSLPAGIGYVRIQIRPATSKEAIQEALRNNDGPGVGGWIVDLRDSRGGDMWPPLAGIGSLLGDGIAGFFIDAANRATPWGYANGHAWLETGAAAGPRTVAEVATPYRLAIPAPRVAVLTDIGVASSGEAIAIAFRGRANTRSFGTQTCGLSTAIQQFPLTCGGRVGVVTAVMADRTKKRYGGPVLPD